MERRAINVQGVVQGVGFRPFVYGLANRLDLAGFVQNRVGGVLIEVEGKVRSLEQFLIELTGHPPPLALIERVSWESLPVRGGEEFRIAPSEVEAPGRVFVSPDVATCRDCLAELLDPTDSRYRYPFLNCTNCGPRLTIIQGAPYDRERTTMASFPMCSACRQEYEDPGNRRFHAQPTCCPECGPVLQVLSGQGCPREAADPVDRFAAAICCGQIGALKGLGGYHLVCDSRDEAVVAELRRRKHRDEKPFALMVGTLAEAERLCQIGPAERDLLSSPRRPIVLLRKRPGAVVAKAVAPHNPFLGIMLPYTPLHHLLMKAVAGVPLVMTSGNRSDEPIAYEDRDAGERLAGIADLFLTHNRQIHVRCEDSVTRVAAGQELIVRRSRGYAPEPLTLPLECPGPILAVGGQLKAAFALGRGRHALLSHHLGDLDQCEAYRAFVQDVELYQQLFEVWPDRIAHDLHPDYASTRYAQGRSRVPGKGIPVQLVGVQHHHAHLASCMAEHGLVEPVLGVIFDGTGYGTDGTVWGGEFLVGDYLQFHRAARLRTVGMAGGDRAIREPWRMALAHLRDAGAPVSSLQQRVPVVALRTAERMLERRLNTPLTSSMGRLFDAFAALIGLRDHVSYEGQAAMELEWLAMQASPDETYPFDLVCGSSLDAMEIDTRPLIRAGAEDLVRHTASAVMARRFHSTLVEVIAAVVGRLRQTTGLEVVVLSGGVFMNALLTEEVDRRLQSDGFRVHRHRLVPPNDGGLSLGQLAVAAALAS
jgi:hydrogenase maturation protein HypF